MNNNSRAPLPPPYPELQKLWCSSPVHPHQASPIIGHVSANCSWSFRQDGSVHTSVEATKDTNVSRFFARHFTELQAAALFDQNNFEKHRDPGQVGDFEAWKYSRNYWRRQEDIKNLSLGPRAFLLSQQSGGSPDQVVLNQNAATVQPDGANLCSDFLPLAATLLSEKLTGGGYVSHFVGKGHLGYETMDHLPVNRGFKSHVGYLEGSQSYYWGCGSAGGEHATAFLKNKRQRLSAGLRCPEHGRLRMT